MTSTPYSSNFPQRRDPQPINSKPITIMYQTGEPQEHIHHVSVTDFDGISSNGHWPTGVAIPRRVSSKTVTHPIWNHFEINSVQQLIRCQVVQCQRVLAWPPNTTSAKKHLRAMHPDLFEQYEASLEAAEAVQKLGNQSSSPVIHVQMKKEMIDGSQDGSSSSQQRHYFTAPQLHGEQRFVISNTINTRGGLEMEEEEEDYDDPQQQLQQQQQQQNEQELDTNMTNDEDSVLHTWESSRDHRKNIANEDDSVMVEEFDDGILMHSDSVNSAVHEQKQDQKHCSPSQLSSNESSQTPNEQQRQSEETSSQPLRRGRGRPRKYPGCTPPPSGNHSHNGNGHSVENDLIDDEQHEHSVTTLERKVATVCNSSKRTATATSGTGGGRGVGTLAATDLGQRRQSQRIQQQLLPMPDESAGDEIDDVFEDGDIKMSALNDPTILVSRAGGEKLIIGGYTYTKHRSLGQNSLTKSTWRCSNYPRIGCKGRVHMEHGNAVITQVHLNECAKYTRPPKKAKWTVKREFGSVGGVDSPLNAAATFSGAKRQKTARMNNSWMGANANAQPDDYYGDITNYDDDEHQQDYSNYNAHQQFQQQSQDDGMDGGMGEDDEDDGAYADEMGARENLNLIGSTSKQPTNYGNYNYVQQQQQFGRQQQSAQRVNRALCNVRLALERERLREQRLRNNFLNERLHYENEKLRLETELLEMDLQKRAFEWEKQQLDQE